MKSSSIQSPKSEISQALEECRKYTSLLTYNTDHDNLTRQAHPEFSPIGWHLGHIAFTEAYWILEKLAGLSPLFPKYKNFFAADGLPKKARQNLPPLAELQTYLKTVRLKTLDYLATANLDDQLRLWWWLIQHESQHSETIAIIKKLQQLDQSFSSKTISFSDSYPGEQLESKMVRVAAGNFLMGSNDIKAQDNEKPAHLVYVDSYLIDLYPVTIAQYQKFINSQGYQNSQYWSHEGWQWLQKNQLTHPLYWSTLPEHNNYPVCGVSYYEAEAYANFVGKRLPTEAEWEKAAQKSPPNNTDDRCYAMLGNVWEWTSSWFQPYPKFSSFPYKGYSQAYFDNQHRVLKGGSYVTQNWAMRPSFRNWYNPWVRQIFAGFRCAQDS